MRKNAQKKNSDSHIYFVTQEIAYKTKRLNLLLLAYEFVIQCYGHLLT